MMSHAKLQADCHFRHYHAHVRSHFMTNMGVAGGLILLQSFGAGRFAVDSLMRKKD